MRFIQPESVISTVPISSGNRNTKSIPKNWLTGTTSTSPVTTSQKTLTSFLKARKNSVNLCNDKQSDKLSIKSTREASRSLSIVCDDAGSYGSRDTDFML